MNTSSDLNAANGGPRTYTSALVIVTSLFFMWGFITVLVDALIPRLRDVFELSYFAAGLLQFAFFTAYFVFSIPSGGMIARIGYKKGVVVGLVTMGVACLLFYPAASLRIFPVFMLAMFVLAGGITILQVAANPYVAALGPAETAASRLNLSQAFNSLGTTLAPLVSAAFILSSTVMSSAEVEALSESDRMAYYISEAAAVQGPFLVLAGVLIALAVFFMLVKLPRILEGDDDKGGSYRQAFAEKHLMFGAIGIFVYVGAEVSIGSYLVNYLQSLDVTAIVEGSALAASVASLLSGSDPGTLNPARLAGTFVALYWGGAMVGRFLGSYLQLRIHPGRLLATYALVNVSLLAMTMALSGSAAFWTVLSIGLFNSIMFPTIFTLAIDGLGNHTAQGSGILCTAIVGGAIIPPLYGLVADTASLTVAFLVPMVCYLYIAWYGRVGSQLRG